MPNLDTIQELADNPMLSFRTIMEQFEAAVEDCNPEDGYAELSKANREQVDILKVSQNIGDVSQMMKNSGFDTDLLWEMGPDSLRRRTTEAIRENMLLTVGNYSALKNGMKKEDIPNIAETGLLDLFITCLNIDQDSEHLDSELLRYEEELKDGEPAPEEKKNRLLDRFTRNIERTMASTKGLNAVDMMDGDVMAYSGELTKLSLAEKKYNELKQKGIITPENTNGYEHMEEMFQKIHDDLKQITPRMNYIASPIYESVKIENFRALSDDNLEKLSYMMPGNPRDADEDHPGVVMDVLAFFKQQAEMTLERKNKFYQQDEPITIENNENAAEEDYSVDEISEDDLNEKENSIEIEKKPEEDSFDVGGMDEKDNLEGEEEEYGTIEDVSERSNSFDGPVSIRDGKSRSGEPRLTQAEAENRKMLDKYKTTVHDDRTFARLCFLAAANDAMSGVYAEGDRIHQRTLINDLFSAGRVLNQDGKPYTIKQVDKAVEDSLTGKDVYLYNNKSDSYSKISFKPTPKAIKAFENILHDYKKASGTVSFDGISKYYQAQPAWKDREHYDNYYAAEFAENRIDTIVKSLEDTDTFMFKGSSINGHEQFQKLRTDLADYRLLQKGIEKGLDDDELLAYLGSHSNTMAARIEAWKKDSALNESIDMKNPDTEDIKFAMMRDMARDAKRYQNYAENEKSKDLNAGKTPSSRREQRSKLADNLVSAISSIAMKKGDLAMSKSQLNDQYKEATGRSRQNSVSSKYDYSEKQEIKNANYDMTLI